MTELSFTGEILEWIDPEATGHLFMNDMAAVAFCSIDQREVLDAAIAELRRLGVPQDRSDGIMRSEGMQYAVAVSAKQRPVAGPKLQAWWNWTKALDALNWPLLSRLIDGSLRAFGDPEAVGSFPHWIAPRAWNVLRPDRQWARKMIGGGAVFWNVRVVDPSTIARPLTKTAAATQLSALSDDNETQVPRATPIDTGPSKFEQACEWMQREAVAERQAGRLLKGEPAKLACAVSVRCTAREAKAAFQQLSADLRRTRGRRDR